MNPLPFLPRVRQHLEPAIRRGGGTHTFEDAMLCVMRGEMQLWTSETASAVTEVNTYPRKKVVHWIWAGGDMAGVLDFQDSVRRFAKSLGCQSMTLGGRWGWKRQLRTHGWTPKGIIMEAEL